MLQTNARHKEVNKSTQTFYANDVVTNWSVYCDVYQWAEVLQHQQHKLSLFLWLPDAPEDAFQWFCAWVDARPFKTPFLWNANAYCNYKNIKQNNIFEGILYNRKTCTVVLKLFQMMNSLQKGCVVHECCY